MNSLVLQRYSSIQITVHLARSGNGLLYHPHSRRMKTKGQVFARYDCRKGNFRKRKLRSIAAATSLSASSGDEAPCTEQSRWLLSAAAHCNAVAKSQGQDEVTLTLATLSRARRQDPPFWFPPPFQIVTFTNQQPHETKIVAACSQNIMSH